MVAILKGAMPGARVGSPEPEELPAWWDFDLVREQLADAAELWWRSPGDGQSPYATDGPWHLLLRETRAGDYDARGGDGSSSDVVIRPLPLTTREVAKRDRISEWLAHVEKPEDRKLIVVASGYLARGSKRVPWRKVKHQLGVKFGEDGLRRRYERAIGAIAKALNAAE